MRGFLSSCSAVAAGGIVTFHPLSLAVGLRDYDRLCDSLILSIQESFPMIFRYRDTRSRSASADWRMLDRERNLRSFPCILLSGLSYLDPDLHRKSDRLSGSLTHLLYHLDSNLGSNLRCNWVKIWVTVKIAFIYEKYY